MASYLSQLTSYLGSTPVEPPAAAQRILSQVDEAFGTPGSSERKADAVAQAALNESSEKKESIPTYGYLETFNLGYFVSFKAIYGWATPAEFQKQDLYEAHQEIHSAIQKVIQAYQNYVASSRAVVAAHQQIKSDMNTLDGVRKVTLTALKTAKEEERSRGKAFFEASDDLARVASKHEPKISEEKSDWNLRSRDAYNRVISAMYEAFKAQGIDKEKVNAAIHDSRCCDMPESWL